LRPFGRYASEHAEQMIPSSLPGEEARIADALCLAKLFGYLKWHLG
jgi:hypothetical protein